MTTGFGLSYRFVPNRFGAQIAFAPYKDESLTQISAGLTLIFNLIESRNANLFIYQGNHLLFRREQSESYYNTGGYYDNYGYYYPNTTMKTTSTDTYKLNNGVGLGVELIAGKHIGFNIMTGYASYDSFNTINLTGEFALFFKF